MWHRVVLLINRTKPVGEPSPCLELCSPPFPHHSVLATLTINRHVYTSTLTSPPSILAPRSRTHTLAHADPSLQPSPSIGMCTPPLLPLHLASSHPAHARTPTPTQIPRDLLCSKSCCRMPTMLAQRPCGWCTTCGSTPRSEHSTLALQGAKVRESSAHTSYIFF
jgi:hypothetical protein